MVEAPRTVRPAFQFCAAAFRISSQSKPAWPKNEASSEATTARRSRGEMRSSATGR